MMVFRRGSVSELLVFKFWCMSRGCTVLPDGAQRRISQVLDVWKAHPWFFQEGLCRHQHHHQQLCQKCCPSSIGGSMLPLAVSTGPYTTVFLFRFILRALLLPCASVFATAAIRISHSSHRQPSERTSKSYRAPFGAKARRGRNHYTAPSNTIIVVF